MTTHRKKQPAGKLAQGLGWFSIGLGLAEAVAPGAMARLIGMEDHSKNRLLLRLFGLREITAGVGLLSGNHTANWLWARVGGDAMDLTALGVAAEAKHANRGRLTAAAMAVAGVTALDIFAAKQSDVPPESETVDIERSITVQGAPEALEAFWRDPYNLAQIMQDFAEVNPIGENRTQWMIHAPLGQTLRWDAEIAPNRPGEVLRWESLPGAKMRSVMTLRFQTAPNGRGTEVFLRFRFDPPQGALGVLAAHLPDMALDLMASKVLRNFKSLFETGEIPTLDHNPSARASKNGKHPQTALSGAKV